MTPELASKYLEHNISNRNLSNSNVNFYADQMRNGKWMNNGETIKIATDGTLIDGQHRLSAIIKSGVSMEMVVVDNISLDSVPTIDTGRARTASDVLSMKGIKYSTSTAGGARVILAHRRGRFTRAKGPESIKISNNEILDFVAHNEDIYFSARLAKQKRLTNIIVASFVVGLHFLFSKVDEDQANLFFSDLESGAGLTEFDPVFALRNRLIESRMTDKKEKKLSRGEIYAMTIKAWNFRRSNDKIKQLRFLSTEKFPDIK
jgi:hypothetical protein